MKTNKVLILLFLLFLIIMFSLYAISINNKNENAYLKKYNIEYEKYLNKTITGIELATLINKAINQNQINNIQKNENGHYIENKEDSIKIEIKVALTNKTYPMEEFYNSDTSEFIKFFSEEQFICTRIEYHEKTGKISKLNFKQIEN